MLGTDAVAGCPCVVCMLFAPQRYSLMTFSTSFTVAWCIASGISTIGIHAWCLIGQFSLWPLLVKIRKKLCRRQTILYYTRAYTPNTSFNRAYCREEQKLESLHFELWPSIQVRRPAINTEQHIRNSPKHIVLELIKSKTKKAKYNQITHTSKKKTKLQQQNSLHLIEFKMSQMQLNCSSSVSLSFNARHQLKRYKCDIIRMRSPAVKAVRSSLKYAQDCNMMLEVKFT